MAAATTGGRRGRRTSVVAAAVLVAVVAGGALWSRASRGPDLGTVADVASEVPVTAMDIGAGPANNSPAIAADPNQPRFMALASRKDAPDFDCALHVSGNGGRGWMPVDPVPQLPPGSEKCYAPDAAFDRDGVLYYLFVGLHGPGNEPMGAFLTTSADRGQSWSQPWQVLGPLNFGVRMAIDRTWGPSGRVHLVWLHATSDPPSGGFGPPPNPVLAAYSDDGGRTFSDPVQVSDPGSQLVVAPTLALGSDQRVHVGYYDLADDVRDYQGLEGPTWTGTWSVLVASSDDGGRSFARAVVVDDEVVPPERPMLIFTMAPPALVAQGDQVCSAWTDARAGDADVLARCSEDRGRTWGSPRRVNDDPVGNGLRQYLPRLSFSSTGRLDAIFYDRRADPGNVLNHVFYTFSDDGGRRFAPNIRLTSDPSDSRIGQQYLNTSAAGQYDIGSRLALWSAPSAAVAAWADTRNSLAGTAGQDIFATEVGAPEELAPGAVVAPLAVGGLALLAAAGWVRRGRNLRSRLFREEDGRA